MKINISLFFFLIVYASQGLAQISGMWHSSNYDYPISDYSMKLKGKVKSWNMTKHNGKTRTLTFDKNGEVKSDTYSGTTQTFIPPDFMLIKLKNKFEKKHPFSLKKDSCLVFNDSMQLLERSSSSFSENNSFDHKGKILIHQEYQTSTQTGAWDAYHQGSSTYSYTLNTGLLVLYSYNKKGSLTMVEYFNSDPFKNVKKVFIYDKNNHLIETNRYDSYNISVGNMPDNYLNKIADKEVDTTFSIDAYFPSYWDIGSPSVCKYKYNEKGQRIEYTAYGYKKGLSFKAEWAYDEKGNVVKEIHYDVYRNRIQRIIDFDEVGNVIKEKYLGYDGGKDMISTMKIEYY